MNVLLGRFNVLIIFGMVCAGHLSAGHRTTIVPMKALEPKVIGWNSIGDGWGPFPDLDQGAPIYDPAGPAEVPHGSKAKLKRNSDNIVATVNTKGLEPGAYTIWLVVLNEGVKIFLGDGIIVKSDGKGRFRFKYEVGDSPESIAQSQDDGFMASLIDATEEDRLAAIKAWSPYVFETSDINAEIHLVVKWHGPVEPANDLWQQTNTFQGECVRLSARDLDFRHPLLGKVGKEMCYDPQRAIFPAVD